jgi:serine/threonine protein phosphatase PrpC
MPIIHIFSGRTHKRNESITDCQDCFQINEAENCLAIADGASQSFYPNIWAELLVNNFCQNPEINRKNWQTWLAPIQNEWLQEVQQRVTKAETEKRPVWVTNKNRLNFQEAATSTFIGLQFLDNQVKVSIVGDSCLFILKGNELKQTYLLKSSKDFNDRPAYFASYPKNNQYVPSFFDIPLDSKKSQDCFYFILATDALSEYIFQCREQEKNIFNTLLKISSQGEFENFVAEVRNAENIRMKNDDVTLIILSCDDRTLAFKGEPNGKEESNHKTLPVPNPKTENIGKQQEKANRILKQQRFVLGILAVLFSVFILVDKIIIKHKNSEPQVKVEPQTLKTIQLLPLPKGSIIYKNSELREVLVDSLSNSSEVKIIEQQGGWIKVEIDLYAFTELLVNTECADCSYDEIEIRPSQNLRVFPSKSEQDVFGKLKDKSKFKKIKFDALPNWSKFKFVGYIKK